IAGRTVRAFNAAGAQIGTTTTASDGSYSLSLDGLGTFYVAVDAPAVTAAGTTNGGTEGNVLGEQTYASAGTGNGGSAGGTGFGPLCVSTDGAYAQQPTATVSGEAGNPANGACYGGR